MSAVTGLFETILNVSSWSLTAGIAIGAGIALLDRPKHPLLIAAAAAGPVALPLGVMAAVSALFTGNEKLTVGAFLAAMLWRIAAAPRGDRRRAETNRGLSLLSANLLFTNRKTEATAKRIASEAADVIITVEAAEDMRIALATTLQDHSMAGLGSGPRGEMVAIWVRNNIDWTEMRLELPDGSFLPGILTLVDGKETMVIGVHLNAPVNASSRDLWVAELRSLRAWAAEQDREIVLGGDFNAALNHSGMRELVEVLPDAARSLGKGMLRTWPARGFKKGRGRCVPIFGLDHVLTSRGLAAQSISTRLYPGCDHLALVVEIGSALGGDSTNARKERDHAITQARGLTERGRT